MQYGGGTRPRDDEEVQLLRNQIEQLQSRVACKTETILRLGKDLEDASKKHQLIVSKCSTYERNLERAEAEVNKLLDAEIIFKSSWKKEKMINEEIILKAKRETEMLRRENADLKEERNELRKDCKLFRQQIAKFEVEKIHQDPSTSIDEPKRVERNRSSGCMSEDNLGKHEKLYQEYKQMEMDLHTVLGVKEELVMERDSLLKKIDRLTSEMSYLLNGDPRRVAEDIDSLLAENRFLKAQLSSAQEESETIKTTLDKYKMMAESKQSQTSPGAKKDNTLEEKSSVAVINMKQIRELLASHSIELDDSDYRAITTILLDLCNDKQMALTHLRRANKVLGSRLHEVENHLGVLEAKISRSPSPRTDVPTPQSTSQYQSANSDSDDPKYEDASQGDF